MNVPPSDIPVFRTVLLSEEEEEEEEEEEFISSGNWRGKHNSLSRGAWSWGEPGCQGGKPPCKQAKRVRPEGGCGVILKEIFLIFYYFFPKKMTKFDHHFEAKD